MIGKFMPVLWNDVVGLISFGSCRIRDDFEKEDAFHGLCAMVHLEPLTEEAYLRLSALFVSMDLPLKYYWGYFRLQLTLREQWVP
jgi:hypothetical protein